MSTGPGFLDSNDIWQFGEDDAETLMSDLLNKGQVKTSEGFANDRARLDDLEDEAVKARSQTTSVSSYSAAGSSGTTYWATATITFTAPFVDPPFATVDCSSAASVISTQIIAVTTTSITFRAIRAGATPATVNYLVQTVGVLA